MTKTWIKKGHEILSEDKWEQWDKYVVISIKGMHEGMELGDCLAIIKTINEESLEAAVIVINKQNHSNASWGLMKSLVNTFSDKGEEFIKLLK